MDRLIMDGLIRAAMTEADKAIETGNSPFGAILSDANGKIVEAAYNTTKTDSDPTAHAEINLIRAVCKKLKTSDLSPFYLISNAQSCPMCVSAAVKAKIKNFVFGYAEDETLLPKITIFEMRKYCNEELYIHTNILKDECCRQIEKTNRENKKNIFNHLS